VGFPKTIRQTRPLFKMNFFSVGWILTLSLIVKYKYKTVSDVDKGGSDDSAGMHAMSYMLA
jgi:hypothetical protein